MRYLKKFESFIDIEDINNIDSVEGNIRDIFVEYHDLHELVINTVFYEEGIGLPSTIIGSKDNVLEVSLFSKSGISYDDISDEIDMLIDYINSLTDNEVMIYKRLDKNLLFSWMDGFTGIHNTIQLYFVEKVKSKINESLDSKIVDDIDDIFVEMWDSGLIHLVSKDGKNINISILKKKGTVIDFELLKDCVEMTKDYLSELGDFTEFYRFGYVSKRVTTSMTNNGQVNTEVKTRNNIEYSSFPYDFNSDVENKHVLEYSFDYELEGIKIVFSFK